MRERERRTQKAAQMRARADMLERSATPKYANALITGYRRRDAGGPIREVSR